MERLKYHKGQLQQILPTSSTTIIRKEEGIYVSIFDNTIATKAERAYEMARISETYPKLPKGFYSSLNKRLIELKFSGARLKASVSNLIDNFKYPEPLVSEIISFDKLKKVYTYNEICDMVYKGENMDDYVKLPDCKMWARKYDVNNY